MTDVKHHPVGVVFFSAVVLCYVRQQRKGSLVQRELAKISDF